MPRLPRPPIPLATKLLVAYRQLKVQDPKEAVADAEQGRHLGESLKHALTWLASRLNCPRDELRLDHDPALENREKIIKAGKIVGYIPAANDPDHLKYRPHSAIYAGSHHIKTNVRGDHGQYSDNTLAKRERRREKKKHRKKHKWGHQPMRSANRLPGKGQVKFRSRPK